MSAATLFAVCVGAGLPEPRVELAFAPPRRWRWDLAFEEYHVAVEVQGGVWTRGKHVRGRGYENDVEKLAEGQLRGWLVLWLTPGMLADGRGLTLLERALRARGWEG